MKEFLAETTAEEARNAYDVYKPFKFRHVLSFEEPIKMVRTYDNFTNYVYINSKNTEKLAEIDYVGYDKYSKIRQINFNRPYYRRSNRNKESIDFKDDEAEPKSIYGMSSANQISNLVKHKNDVHLKIYQRYNTFYFRLHFQLSNEMQNMGQVNHSYNFTILSMDYLEEKRTNTHLTFAVTKAIFFRDYAKLMKK